MDSVLDVFVAPPLRTPLIKNPQPDWDQLMGYIQRTNPTLSRNSKVINAIEMLKTHRSDINAFVLNYNSKDIGARSPTALLMGPIKNYLSLLYYAMGHFPLSHGAICDLRFIWHAAGVPKVQDKAAPGSINGAYEAASILSIASSLMVAIATTEVQTRGADGARRAFRLLQQAAGICDRNIELTRTLQAESPALTQAGDLSYGSLCFFSKLYLAYAHHSAYLKAYIEDQQAQSLLAKLAAEGANAYTNLRSQAQQLQVNNIFLPAGMNFETSCAFSAAIMRARANLHASFDLEEKGEIGVAVGYLNASLDLLEWGSKCRVSDAERGWLDQVTSIVRARHEKLSEENNTVHFERVPREVAEIEGIGRLLGKSLPTALYCSKSDAENLSPSSPAVDSNDPFNFVKDLIADPFLGIIPMHVVVAARQSREKVRAMVKQFGASVAAHRAKVRRAMSDMGVTAAVANVTGELFGRGRVPEALRKRLLELRRKATVGGAALLPPDDKPGNVLEPLIDRMNATDKQLKDCLTLVRSLEARFDEEAQSEAALRDKYTPALWDAQRIPPLAEIAEATELRQVIDALKANVESYGVAPLNALRSFISSSLAELVRLDWPLQELDALMPGGGAMRSEDRASKHLVECIRVAIESIEGAERKEEELLASMNAMVESDELLSRLSSTTTDQHECVIKAHHDAFSAEMNKVSAIMTSCDKELVKVQEAMAALASLKSTDLAAEKAAKVCAQLEGDIDVYLRLSRSIEETENYAAAFSKHTQDVKASADSFFAARKSEQEELARHLEERISSKMRSIEAIKSSQQKQLELAQRIALLEKQQSKAKDDKQMTKDPFEGFFN